MYIISGFAVDVDGLARQLVAKWAFFFTLFVALV